MADFIPSNWSAFGDWSQNFNTQLQVLAPKYGISAAKLAQTAKDNAWIQYWVPSKVAAKNQKKQLDDYVSAVSNGALNDPKLNDPTWALAGEPPVTVDPGVKKRFREIAAFIKAQKSIYTQADGELLGIVSADESNSLPDSYTPDVKFDSEPNFALEAEFRKYGLDALRIEFRHKGGEWQLAAILTSSPGVFNIHPATAGQAEQIELRCVFIVKNQPYGNYSPIYTAVIQP